MAALPPIRILPKLAPATVHTADNTPAWRLVVGATGSIVTINVPHTDSTPRLLPQQQPPNRKARRAQAANTRKVS